MYKVAISDLDGTLLGPDHKLSSQTQCSIQRWIESGRKFVIATGRHYIEAKSIQEKIAEPLYLISSNGARVHNKAGEIILKQNLPSSIATEICNIEFPERVQTNIFTDQHWYANFHLAEFDEMALDKRFYCQTTDLKTVDKSNTIKIFFCAEPAVLQLVQQQLLARFGDRINLTLSLTHCLEVMDAHANKGNAVAAVLQEQGLASKDAIAFGDAMNDIEMLAMVAKPVLMANSQPSLRSALPQAEVTLSSQEDGVAIQLERLLS